MACCLVALSHYLNQWLDIVNWTPRKKLQWHLIRNIYIFIQENDTENAICKMAAILSQPKCVKLNSRSAKISLWHFELWCLIMENIFEIIDSQRRNQVLLHCRLWSALCLRMAWHSQKLVMYPIYSVHHFDGLVQERGNSSALAMELRLSFTNPSIWCY